MGVNPTNLMAYYDSTPTDAESGGYTGGRFNGTHAAGSDNEGAGQVGVWLQQDRGRVRDILIRKYTYPEPVVTAGTSEDAKGVIPVGSGTPFYTTNSNPRTAQGESCLAGLQGGESCDLSWTVYVNGDLNTTWTFFTEAQATNYSAYISLATSDTRDLTIVSYPLPLISNIQCNVTGSGWQACTSVAYDDTITALRAQCTSQSGELIQNMAFRIDNLQDNATLILANTTDNTTGYWTAPITPTTIQDSGNFTLYSTCTENVSVTDETDWFIPWGILIPSITSPAGNADVIQNRFFNFTSQVTCSGGECGSITAILDPLPNPWTIVNMTFENQTDFPEEGQCGTAAANQCAATEPWDGFDWCQAANGGYGMCASTEANAIGTRGFECRACDRNDADNNGGLYINLSADACGGEPCQTINLSFYQIVESVDNPYEGSAVLIRNTNGTYQRITECLDGDPTCDCNAITGCTRATMGSYAKFYSTNLCSVSGIDCEQNISIWFTAYNSSTNHGTGDYFAWDEISIVGKRSKGVIPMNAGDPFYTITQNPRYAANLSCLTDMKDGDTCSQTWGSQRDRKHRDHLGLLRRIRP
ncbi:MAG: hypothetical protein HC945_02235 [Nitrosarchaeum sp.]|nr:hypothetical protein [Nitrosarchaeum sp.]